MQATRGELDLVPLQVAHLGGPQPMSVGEQDHSNAGGKLRKYRRFCLSQGDSHRYGQAAELARQPSAAEKVLAVRPSLTNS